MAGSIHGSSPLQAAQAASFAKGQELTRQNSKDKKEDSRLLGQLLSQAQEQLNQKKTKNPNKGQLA